MCVGGDMYVCVYNMQRFVMFLIYAYECTRVCPSAGPNRLKHQPPRSQRPMPVSAASVQLGRTTLALAASYFIRLE